MSAPPLGRSRRLVSGAVFQALLRKGRRTVRGPIVARALPSAEAGGLGLSIAKRFLKKATDRNLVKRIVREAYHAQVGQLSMTDVLVMLGQKPAVKGRAARRELRQAVDNTFSSICSYRPSGIEPPVG